jgi:hypothetical protein
MVKIKSPILITGAPHSGKSLLAKILSQNSQFFCFGGPLSLWNIGMQSSADDVRTESDATPEVTHEIRAGIQKILSREEKERYVDDFSYHSLRIPFINKVLPEAKVIMMVRDPADVIPEMMYFWRYRDPFREAWKRHRSTISLSTLPSLARRFIKNYIAVRLHGRRESWGPTVPTETGSAKFNLAEKVAVQWESLVRIGLDDLQEHMENRSMIVKFEDMVSCPAPVVHRIAKFCEIDEREVIVDYASRLLDSTYRFEKRDIVDVRTSSVLDQIIKNTRQRVGYESRKNWM